MNTQNISTFCLKILVSLYSFKKTKINKNNLILTEILENMSQEEKEKQDKLKKEILEIVNLIL